MIQSEDDVNYIWQRIYLIIYIYIFLWHSTLQVTHPKELETAEAKGITSDPWDSENPKTLKLCIWKK